MGARILALVLAFGAGFAALYLGTRGRWNWPRLVGRAMLGLVILVGTVGGWVYWSSLPPTTPVTELWSIVLGAHRGDVRFLKGEPSAIVEPDTWVYAPDRSRTYYVTFADTGSVSRILVVPGPGFSSGYALLGVREGFDLESLIDRLGQPTEIVDLPDGLRRAYLYRHLSAMFVLRRGAVESFGIYDVEARDPYVER